MERIENALNETIIVMIGGWGETMKDYLVIWNYDTDRVFAVKNVRCIVLLT